MKPENRQAFRAMREQRVALIGMSGVGKTRLSHMLRESGHWYHYSVDYRLGSEYLAPHINDDLRDLAMRTPKLANLLKIDAVKIRAKFGIENLHAMSDYLGKIGNSLRGGLERDVFLDRQSIHENAEREAMHDVADFVRRGRSLYGYQNFVCDTSGSFCSVVDPWNAEDPILTDLASQAIILYIESSEEDQDALVKRFRQHPKPIFYSEPFFSDCETEYLKDGKTWGSVNPDDFAEWAFERIVTYRLPRYREIAKSWGYTISSKDLENITNEKDFRSLLEAKVCTGETCLID